jgi:hypothetical protein
MLCLQLEAAKCDEICNGIGQKMDCLLKRLDRKCFWGSLNQHLLLGHHCDNST